jgi:hypothetical protein
LVGPKGKGGCNKFVFSRKQALKIVPEVLLRASELQQWIVGKRHFSEASQTQRIKQTHLATFRFLGEACHVLRLTRTKNQTQ